MDTYFKKYQSYIYPLSFYRDRPIEMGIVIPIYNEPDIWTTIKSIEAQNTTREVRIVLVLNHEVDAPGVVKDRHHQQAEEIEKWISQVPPNANLQYDLIKRFDLENVDSGVGNARKVGMDSLAYWLHQNHSAQQVIITNLDADCEVAPTYVERLYLHHQQYRWNGCSIGFAHRPLQNGSKLDWEACVRYEIHLRLFILSLRITEYPLAFQTIGSAMACTNSAYLRQGGMVRKKAGEDFYFIQKLLPLGNYCDLPEPLVFPLARQSDRVPFGTGKAINKFLASGIQYTYHPDNYQDISMMCRNLPNLYRDGLNGLFSEVFQQFLESQNIDKVYKTIKSNTSDFRSFRKRWFTWFNNFRVMKWFHFARSENPDIPVEEAMERMKDNLGTQAKLPEEQLQYLRDLDYSSGVLLDKNFNVKPL